MIAWTGTYVLPASAAPVAMSVEEHGSTATVSLGPGHSGATDVAIGASGTRVRFVLPGGVEFDGIVRRRALMGTVRQGALRGRFTLRRGVSRLLPLLGVYHGPQGDVAIVQPEGVPPILVELPSGATHGIGPSLTVGARLGDTRGNGSVVPTATGFTWKGTSYRRLALRQREIRVGVDAATLTLPPGRGPFPAVVTVHGSGVATRDEFDVFTMDLALHGVAVLADDKRGTGESQGAYPGDVATISTLSVLAADARREVRYLASLPQIDARRIGLWGDSQGGWIVPLAASRNPLVHWAILNSGPTVTVGESDLWASLAGASESPPSGTRAKMLAEVRASGPSGFDPAPALRSLAIPVLWMYGSDDRNVPTELCVDRLRALQPGHDFSWYVLPTAHTPLVLPTGLLSSLPRSPGFDPRFFPDVARWLQARGITH
ncbi:MAG: alpha/beta hydrolase [Actinobacteria bacterium]|nr:alpha/beta hydrolase [Actinomycetota bacterium]